MLLNKLSYLRPKFYDKVFSKQTGLLKRLAGGLARRVGPLNSVTGKPVIYTIPLF